MKLPRLIGASLLFLAVAATLASCSGGVINPQGWAAPTFDDATLYYFPDKDRLAAVPYAADPLAETWLFPNKARQSEKELKIEAAYGEPVRDGDRVYLAPYQEGLFALNRTDGSIAWGPRPLKGLVLDGPTLANGRLFVATDEGYLYAFDTASGNRAPGWEQPRKFQGGIWAAPVAAGDAIVVATMKGRVFAVSAADGSPRWDYKAGGAVASLTLLGDSHLFAPTLQKEVAVLDIATGTPAFSPLSTTDWVWTTPAFRDNVAYFGDLSGQVYALDITTGTVKWTYSSGHKVKSGPAIVDDVLVIADRQPIVHFLTLDGALRNTVPILDAGTVRADVVAGPPSTPFAGKAVIATTKGRLFQATPNGQVVEIAIGAFQQ